MYITIYFILCIASLLCDTKYKIQNKQSLTIFGFNHLYHIYFAIVSSFIQDTELLRNLAFCYFWSDMIIQYYKKCFTTFTLIHHSLTLLSQLPTFYIFNSNYKELMYYYNLFQKQEISNIILNCFLFKIIPEKIYNILFPLTFIIFRVIYFNIDIYFNAKHLYVYFLAIIMNSINTFIFSRMVKRIIKHITP